MQRKSFSIKFSSKTPLFLYVMTSTLIKTQSCLTVKKVRSKALYGYFWCIKLAHYLGKSLKHPLILNIVNEQLHSFNTPSPHGNTHWACK